MKPFNVRLSFASFCILAMLSCVEPYAPPEIAGDPDFLVIDSFLDGTDNSCRARITKAVGLNSDVAFQEIQEPMTVWVEDEQGSQHFLYEMATGQYEAAGLPLDHQKKYKLVVTIAGRETYESEFVEIMQTPPIEKVFFDAREDELRLLVNTTDVSGKGGYYRWTWVETFEYTSNYNSNYKIVGTQVYPRSGDELVYRCYKTTPSSNIMVASSTDLDSDVIRNYQVQSIPRNSQKLQHRYSLNVRQMALSEDAYTYWLNLFKTTENLGGLFDPMPGEVIGNFRKTSDPSAVVIGYFSAATTHEQRIFITPRDLPQNYGTFLQPYCPMDTVLLEELPGLGPTTMLISALYSEGFPVLIGYSASTQSCVDCQSIYGGVTEKPPFWP